MSMAGAYYLVVAAVVCIFVIWLSAWDYARRGDYLQDKDVPGIMIMSIIAGLLWPIGAPIAFLYWFTASLLAEYRKNNGRL